MENEITGNFIEEIIADDLKSGRVKSVRTRFPPEPNGYLHIGHAKALCVDFGAAEKFGGKCNLRFDDTNPAKEDAEYVEAIKADVKWLGFKWDGLYYASDFFGKMYAAAESLILKGMAYACGLSADEVRETRGTLTEGGRESPYRNRSVGENLELFRRMRDGDFKDGEMTLRAKIDMNSPNLNMRDPVLYRILRAPHHRTGNDWIIYPMYDFAHPLEDAFEGVTHSLCTLEFEDHRPFYDWVIRNAGPFDPAPRQTEFARLAVARTPMSKRLLKKFVDDKAVDGWDDPRMPTLSGMRRRGYPAAAIRDFCARVGVAKANGEVELGLLEHCARENLNARSKRVMAVLDPLPAVIENYPAGKTETAFIENNPNDPDGGRHRVRFGREIFIERADFMSNPPPKYHRMTEGGYVRLKGAYIVRCTRAERDAEGNVTRVFAEFIEGTKSGGESPIKAKGVIHWVNAADAVDIKARLFEPILNEAGEFNAESLRETSAKASPEVLKSKPGAPLQFIRNGYFCRDARTGVGGETGGAGGVPVFNRIVALKDGFVLTAAKK